MKNKKVKYVFLGIVILTGIIGIFIVYNLFNPGNPRSKHAIIESGVHQMGMLARKVYFEEKSYENLLLKQDTKTLSNYIYDVSGYELIIHATKNEYCAYTRLVIPEENNYACLETDKDYIITDINPGSENYCDGKTFLCPQKIK